jgi:glycerol-3-phosphate dehydrogenase
MAPFDRGAALAAMATTTYDVVVIGAGMTGAGVAVDAASRGLRVSLIDAGDIASGTSSKSSKMVHGGLRYLQQKEFRLVYENLRERRRLLQNAPFLVRPLPFLIPLFGSDGVASKALVKGYATALRLYDLSGGWRIGQRYRRVTRDEALAHLPTLHVERLVAGFLYIDARGDDARVALTLARTAALDFDADVATYVRAIDITRDDRGRAHAVIVRDELDRKSVV